MEPTSWAPEHSAALQEHLGRGLTFSEVVEVINAKFKTAYSRNAAIGRARRMGLAGADWPKVSLSAQPPRLDGVFEVRSARSVLSELHWPRRVFEQAERPKLRCVEIEPRHLSLIELERGDCRYPYGGDEEGEAITFCGHPKRPGVSYCTPHFHLSRNPEMPAERTASAIPLRVVKVA